MPYADPSKQRRAQREHAKRKRLELRRAKYGYADMMRRHRLALWCVRHHGLDPHLALAWTVWPDEMKRKNAA